MLKIKQRTHSKLPIFVFCVVIAMSNFVFYDLSASSIAVIGLSIMAFTKFQRSYFKWSWPLLVIFIVGFIGAPSHESIHILRDFAFALTPISLLFIGYWMAGNRVMLSLILKMMFYFGFVLAVAYLLKFVFNPELLAGESMDIRQEVGGVGDVVVLAFIIGLFSNYFGVTDLLPRLHRFIAIPILLASIMLSFSRTELAITIILSFALLGWLSRVNPRFLLSIAVVFIGYIVLVAVTPTDEEGTFRSKIVRSAEEVAISDYDDYLSISQNWRGFESDRAVKTFLIGDPFQIVFGGGFGALVDLGFDMQLGGDGSVSFRYIPITHNGYVYVLVKAGLVGLICYVLFYVGLLKSALRYSRSINSEQIGMSRLLLGCVLSLILSMYVVGGMAEAHNFEIILLTGFLVNRLVLVNKEQGCVVIVRGRL